MDYDSDSSDFHFPSDTGLAKLSSPLSFKIPESRDWALDEFMQTLQDKPCTEAENLLSFKQYIPVQNEEDEDEDDEEDDFLNYEPPKLSLPTLEEKDFLSQLSQHFLNLERIELHDILKGGFTLVQNDIQSNNTQNYNHTTHISSPPGLSWFNEAVDYGRHEIDNLDTIEIPKRKNNFSPFEQMASAGGRHGNNKNATTVASFSICSEQQEITTVVSPQVEKPLPPLPQSTSLPSAAPTTTTTFVITSNSSSQKKKGLKYILKQFVKPFNKSTAATTTSEKPKKSFIKNTRKLIRNIF